MKAWVLEKLSKPLKERKKMKTQSPTVYTLLHNDIAQTTSERLVPPHPSPASGYQILVPMEKKTAKANKRLAVIRNKKSSCSISRSIFPPLLYLLQFLTTPK